MVLTVRHVGNRGCGLIMPQPPSPICHLVDDCPQPNEGYSRQHIRSLHATSRVAVRDMGDGYIVHCAWVRCASAGLEYMYKYSCRV